MIGLDCDDTTVSRIVRREIAHQCSQIVTPTIAIRITVPSHGDLRCTSLTSHRVVRILQSASGTVINNTFKCILHLFDHLGRSDRLDHHLRRKSSQRLAILFELFDKHRANHLSSIGYGVVETEGFQRRQSQTIPIRHHRQCHTTP